MTIYVEVVCLFCTKKVGGDWLVTEIWKPVVGYEGYYEVSNLGNVKSLHTDKYLSLSVNNKTGYVKVSLFKPPNSKKYYYVHRLVAKAFIPCEDGSLEVNHIDEDKSNNAVSNLEWCDRRYNLNYGNRNKLIGEANKKRRKISVEDIEKIKFLRDNNTRVREIAHMFGLSLSYTYKLCEQLESEVRTSDYCRGH